MSLGGASRAAVRWRYGLRQRSLTLTGRKGVWSLANGDDGAKGRRLHAPEAGR